MGDLKEAAEVYEHGTPFVSADLIYPTLKSFANFSHQSGSYA